MGIDHAYTCCPFFIFIIDNGMHHAVGSDSQVSGLCSPGYGTGIGTEIAAEGTAPFAFASRLAGVSSLLNMDLTGFGKMGTTSLNHMPVFIMRVYFFADGRFHTIHFPGRKKISVRKGFNSIEIPAD